MVKCMKTWDRIEWDEESEISEHIFGKALKEVTRATALYLATFMDRTEMVRSLISCAGEDNINCCIRNLDLSNQMEEVFMLDIAETLKMKHADLKPVVIPGHCRDEEGKRTRTFIVYSEQVVKASCYTLDDLALVKIRNPYIYTKEVECSTVKQNTISAEDAKRAEKALSIHREMLWRNHSNLNIIGVSPLIYRKNGDVIIEKSCIALYCSTKGVVPLGDPVFPKKLDIGEGDFIDVDVHEGFFRRGAYTSEPASCYHQTLKMGCNIGRSTPEYDAQGNRLQFIGGTHGPFVKFDNKIGFLTCAHVLFDIPVQTMRVDFQHDGTNNKIEIVQPSVDSIIPSGSACGYVHRAIFDPQRNPSIDVGVIEITDASRSPSRGQFANEKHSSYKNAGFDELPEYNSGSIQRDLTHFGTTHIVFKFGSESDITKGTLDVYGVNVRPLLTVLGLPSGSGQAEMNNQYQVFGAYPTMTFSQLGDSGSAVFMKTTGTDQLTCIGMVIGYAYIGTNPFPATVVTPIGAILDGLGQDYSIASFQ
ncbi:uncharacterized protein LOC132564975 [Ylistrum balloti]|uniref:uncharacterized protein LOC132564975 n=1 Tax=Ylistrum balloti TaxID=509963 RepID=UPI002905E434|nr:uncharacterized protein LOC132564975 [Ylistrum balloti]